MALIKSAFARRDVLAAFGTHFLPVSVILLAQCVDCPASDVLISSAGREPAIAAAVPIDVLGNGSYYSEADADWFAWRYRPWVFSAIGSSLVSLSGVLPLLLIPFGYYGEDAKGGQVSGSALRVMLSFAVGGLLGDVFLHLLPEAWGSLPPAPSSNTAGHSYTSHGHGQHIRTGMWVLVGMLVFIIVEKCCPNKVEEEALEESPKKTNEEMANSLNNNIHEARANGDLCIKGEKSETTTNHSPPKKVAGYLNLVANSIDNFTHGLAVGGGFALSLRVGAFTTFAILVHEVPHEIGDFAILLRSGFSMWDAARAQLITGSAGIIGALAASAGAAGPDEAGVSWILPFTAGGFLHIALVSVLPELASESNPRESAKQLVGLVAGILLMAALTIIMES
ncbi:zinc transporter ZIP13 homolog [Ischnura elegans]|uniref:zinc transporter ZIP13 homolog n=1 Tax=Ischnura elegans TaxID=197161 RepID=UPI001ED8A178|nr:zinc transporter ZIP13 homolog [Ischnura elegans]